MSIAAAPLLDTLLSFRLSFTPRTHITRGADLRRQLEEIRRTGLAINRGERRPDIAAVAAPIFDAGGECIAAVSISGPGTRFTDDNVDDFTRHVRKAAEEISMKRGFRGHP